MKRHGFAWLVALACAFASAAAQAGYSGLYVFGDSLSDAGNNALVFDTVAPPPGTLRTPVPIPNAATNGSLIPTFPYRSTSLTPGVPLDRYTDGFVWAELVAQALGLPSGGIASLTGFGSNFAFGGAATGPLDPSGSQFPPSLSSQVAGYLGATGNRADPDALYVVAGGGNNARAALSDIANNPGNAASIILAYATQLVQDLSRIVSQLLDAGARHLLVWNVPDAGKSPAILAQNASAAGTLVASSLNASLETAIWGLPGVIPFDLFDLQNEIVANPDRYGLRNVTGACAAATSCDPSTFLFWDGIHPTSAGHAFIARAVLQAVPEPAMLWLLAIGGLACAVALRRMPKP